MSRTTLLSFVALATAMVAGPAVAATPHCDSIFTVSSAVGRFQAHSERYLGERVGIESVSAIRETRIEPRGGLWPIERRYCEAAITTHDGQRRTLWYLIESGRGFAGIGPEVEFCVSGLDPWKVHGAACSTVR